MSNVVPPRLGPDWLPQLGTRLQPGGGVHFSVWAPKPKSIALEIGGRLIAMEPTSEGVFEATVPQAAPGDEYTYLLDAERRRPDPRSRSQPHGVHGPSAIVDPAAYAWGDASWQGLQQQELIFYELHVGTFTAEGTFEAVIPRLAHLRDLGITALELMPVIEFPGKRDWGYDGVSLFAPHGAYGGSLGLKRLIDAAHQTGLAVFLDVVYNHLGPEGNYLDEFAPYFNHEKPNLWGSSLAFEGAGSGQVREFFIENALMWQTEYHADGLRLDAADRILDGSRVHIVAEIQQFVLAQSRALRRPAWVVAESGLNDAIVLRRASAGGYNVDAKWTDDFHHAIHATLLGEKSHYNVHFPTLSDVRTAIVDAFVYDGRTVDGLTHVYERAKDSSGAAGLPGERFVICAQNHDQVANPALGRRLCVESSIEEAKLATALLFFSPYVPLLFMGEEFAESNPFYFFTDFSDPTVVRNVREGRKKEFEAFLSKAEWIDPQAPGTFEACKLDWTRPEREPHAGVLRYYKTLIALRRGTPCLASCRRHLTRVTLGEEERWIIVERSDVAGPGAVLFVNFAPQPREIPAAVLAGRWRRALASSDREFAGSGPEPASPREAESPGTIVVARHTAVAYVRA